MWSGFDAAHSPCLHEGAYNNVGKGLASIFCRLLGLDGEKAESGKELRAVIELFIGLLMRCMQKKLNYAMGKNAAFNRGSRSQLGYMPF